MNQDQNQNQDQPDVPAHIARMREEQAQLVERLRKLDSFLSGNPAYTSLSRLEQQLLEQQRDAMYCYLRALSARLALS